MQMKSIISSLLALTLANAKLIMIIRHGEKIDDDHFDLSPKGKARADCLVNVFGNNGTFVAPQKIYAQSPSEKKLSTRPMDTVTPLAKSLGLEVDINFTSGKVMQLVETIMNSPEETVLISWSRENIPYITEELGVNDVPEWNKKSFDDVWIVSDGTTSYKNDNAINNYNNKNNDNNNNNSNSNSNINNNNDNNSSNNDFFDTKNNKNNKNIVNTNNINNKYTLTFEKENVDQCINEELKKQGISGSIQLKTTIMMPLFSLCIFILFNLF